MTTITLEDDLDAALEDVSARQGRDKVSVVADALRQYIDLEKRRAQMFAPASAEQESPQRRPSVKELLAMPLTQRSVYLRAAAEDAAPLYEADMALPTSERKLTALTALDGEPFLIGRRLRPIYDIEKMKVDAAEFADEDLALAESGADERAEFLAQEDRA